MSVYRHTDNPVCPHCGWQHDDAWEWNFGAGLEGHTETKCSECEKLFRVFRHAKITYTTILLKSVPMKEVQL